MTGQRLFRLLLLAYPPALRRQFGREMASAFTEAWNARRSVRARLRLLADVIADFVTSWPREWRGRSPNIHPPTPRHGRPMATLTRDFRHALRLFRTAPMFALGAIATLALGIGASSAIFSLADATLLRPLPIPQPDRVVQTSIPWGAADTWDLARLQKQFTATGGWADMNVGLTIGGATTNVTGLAVTGEFFGVVNLPAQLGQLITPNDDRRDGRLVAVLSDALWRQRFAADPGIVGRAITLNRRDVFVMGVAPAGFRGLSLEVVPDVYFPMALAPQIGTGFITRPGMLDRRDLVWMDVALRMRPETTLAGAAAEINALYAQLHPPTAGERPETITLDPMMSRSAGKDSRADLERLVAILLGATLVILLLSCATVANLMLVRAENRRRELAVRMALGASTSSIARLLFVESLAIGLTAAALGVAVARTSLALLGSFLLPGRIEIKGLALTVNPTLLMVAAGLGVLTSVLFGLAPVWRATRLTLQPSLRDGDRGATRQPLRSTLVTAQVALCVMLVGGSFAFGRSIQRAFAINLGFDIAQSTLTTVNPSLVRYDADRVLAYQDQVLAALASAPEIQSAGWATVAPLRGRMQWTALFDGYGAAKPKPVDIDANVISPGYISAMGMRIVEGRDLAGVDRADSAPVVLCNEAAARKFFAGRSAVGGRVSFNDEVVKWTTIVGVVNDVRRELSIAPEPMLYLPLTQNQSILDFSPLRLIARSTLPPASAAKAVAAVLTRVDPIVPIMQQQTMREHLDAVIMPQRLGLTLFALFAGVAIVLTTLGIYAVVAYAVAHRTREIGLRMALGASRLSVLRLVVRQGAVPVAAGLALGLAGFVAASRGLQQFMFDGPPSDAVALLVLSLLVGGVAAVAMIVPASRAARVAPTIALRME